MTDKLTETVEQARYMVNNPSAWDTFDQGASDIIDELLAALRPIDEGVTQADREQAWPFARFHCLPDSQMRERWFEGHYDDQSEGAAIQAFRAHRVAALRGSQS